MSKITRYIILGVAVCMLLAVGIYGVYSASQVSYTLQGSISYTAEFEASLNITHISGAQNDQEQLLARGLKLLADTTVGGTGEDSGSFQLNQTLYFTHSSPTSTELKPIIIALNVSHDLVYNLRVTASVGDAFKTGGDYAGIVTCEISANDQSGWGESDSVSVDSSTTATLYIKFSANLADIQGQSLANSDPLLNIVIESA